MKTVKIDLIRYRELIKLQKKTEKQKLRFAQEHEAEYLEMMQYKNLFLRKVYSDLKCNYLIILESFIDGQIDCPYFKRSLVVVTSVAEVDRSILENELRKTKKSTLAIDSKDEEFFRFLESIFRLIRVGKIFPDTEPIESYLENQLRLKEEFGRSIDEQEFQREIKKLLVDFKNLPD